MTINEGIDAVSKEVCCSNTVHILLHDFVEKFLNFKTFFLYVIRSNFGRPPKDIDNGRLNLLTCIHVKETGVDPSP